MCIRDRNYALTYEGKFDHFDNKTYVAFDKTKNSRLPEYLAGGPDVYKRQESECAPCTVEGKIISKTKCGQF